VNFPLLAVKLAIGEDLELAKMKVKWGSKFVRHWEDNIISD